jgi:hypothetical protein
MVKLSNLVLQRFRGLRDLRGLGLHLCGHVFVGYSEPVLPLPQLLITRLSNFFVTVVKLNPVLDTDLCGHVLVGHSDRVLPLPQLPVHLDREVRPFRFQKHRLCFCVVAGFGKHAALRSLHAMGF